mgnify:FL=1
MANPPRSQNRSEHDPPPGADRFWGQFAQAGKARDNGGAESEAGTEAANGSAPAEGQGHECLEWCPICRSAELLRHAATPEMAQQVLSLQKEAAGVLKAFIQAYSEKVEQDPAAGATSAAARPAKNGDRGPDEGPRVTDITID